MEVTHCKKCGRLLRDPESVARGMGPECAGTAGDRQKEYSFMKHVQKRFGVFAGDRGNHLTHPIQPY